MIAWRIRWNGLARRERVFVASGATILAVAFLFVVAIEPAWHDRMRLATELPGLRDAAARVEALKDTAMALRGRGRSVESGAALRDAARMSLARAALSATADLSPDGALVVTAHAVPAATLLPWLEFFGVIADRAITRIRWEEGPELSFACCEETVIDNLMAAQPVPEPGTWLMMVAGLGLAGWSASRRKAG